MASIDPQLAEKILHEVKSQGVFDEFRKDSIADVDTKPAYQNLRQRVENTAQRFLAEQRWTPDTNKYQLRDRLRRHIVESGFLDVGVERIVDQVVNPKIGSVFQPRIEEIAYNFLGISPPLPTKREPPPPPMPPMPPLPPFPPMNGSPLKIETDVSNNLLPTDLEQVSPDSDKVKEEDSGMLEEKVDDDDESPPFEPLTECKSPKTEENIKKEETKENNIDSKEPKKETIVKVENIKVEPLKNEDSCVPKEKHTSNDALLASQESQLSQVSSDSRISSISNQLLRNGNDATSAMDNTDVNISEEAQMPKFNENSTGTEDSAKNTSELHFDIKKDEIKFEGTERKANMLDPERTEFCKDAPVIKDDFISDSLEMKGSFHFTKLNVEVEPCITTHDPASSVSSQDDTSSAQLCIVERPENDMQGETNSIQKCPQEDSSTNTTINNSQVKQNDNKNERNGKHYSSSSSPSSRLKKSSSKDKKYHSSDRNRSHDSKVREKSKYRERDLERDRERYRDRDRYNDAKYSSKTNSNSSRRHESSEKHKSSSSKRSEKDRHTSISSRSESHSRHKSSKRDHRDKDDKRRSHKYSSSSKEHRSGERKTTRTDDHNESREKIRWRKSTDSNDEDKNNPSNSQQNKSTNDTESGVNASTKSNGNGSNKYSKETKKNDSHESKTSENVKSHNSRVVILNDVLEHPSTNFVEFETKSSVQVHKVRQRSPTPSKETFNMDLLYFEQENDQFQKRLDLLSNAIDRCALINAAMNSLDHTQDDNMNEINNDEHSTSKDSIFYHNDTRTEDMIRHTETKATLLVDCFHYSDCSDKNAHENMETTSPKRLKLSTECNIAKLQAMSSVVNVSTKENQMKENNSIMTDEDNKKSTLSKRIETMTKLSQQQRYSSEDLYKPRPVLGQRSKRRGLDTVI